MVGSARYYGVGKEGGKRRGGAGTSDGDETNYGSMTIMNKVGQNYLSCTIVKKSFCTMVHDN